jgi:hypothetical protein
MVKEQILQVLSDRLEEGSWFLAVLKKANGTSISKEKLKNAVNELYREQFGEDLIKSRHSIDIYTARIEGAGLVDIQEIGRARVYQLSKLGEELINYRRQLKHKL